MYFEGLRENIAILPISTETKTQIMFRNKAHVLRTHSSQAPGPFEIRIWKRFDFTQKAK